MAAAAMMQGAMFDDDICPLCQTDRYMTPSMRLLVGPCYHKLCESCIERVFVHGPAPCPTCAQIVRRVAYAPQTFEDLTVEKEVRIRKRMAQKFNKRQEDFKTLKAFNDYLETVEDMTFKLVNEIDVETTKAEIEKFAAENKDLIRINADRLLNESRMAQHKQELAKKEKLHRQEVYQKELEEEVAAKNEEKRMLIHELATSDKSAKTIMAQRQAITLKRTSMRKTEVKPAATNGPSSLSSTPMLSDAYWRMQQDEEMDRQKEEDEDMDVFDPVQSMYMDVDLGVGYVNSVNNNKAHAGGLVYPLLTSSTGVKDLYIEPRGIPNLSDKAKVGGYRLGFGYGRAIEDAHTGLFTPALA